MLKITFATNLKLSIYYLINYECTQRSYKERGNNSFLSRSEIPMAVEVREEERSDRERERNLWESKVLWKKKKKKKSRECKTRSTCCGFSIFFIYLFFCRKLRCPTVVFLLLSLLFWLLLHNSDYCAIWCNFVQRCQRALTALLAKSGSANLWQKKIFI